MIIFIENRTNKTIKISYNSNSIYIAPSKSEKAEIGAPTLFEINLKKNEKSFKQRIKEEFSVKEVDLLHLRFKMKCCSYLKTIVKIDTDKYKRQTLVVQEGIYTENNISQLNCLTIENNQCIETLEYKCVDKAHKKAIYLLCKFAMLIKYGFIGIIGSLATLLLLFDTESSMQNTDEIAWYFIAFIVFFCFLIMYLVKTFWLIKVLKKL